MKTALRIALACLILSLGALAFALSLAPREDPFDPANTPSTPGQLTFLGKDGKPAGGCPLKHTDVDVQISGFIARVDVVQEFTNPTKNKIEAVYTFPLPEDSAVDHMEMQVGKRTIVGEIHRREEAREIYEAAKEAGHVASLLDQERPNIFTQSVANIMPGENVKITISYTQILRYEAGVYDFVFPMVVGPRFIPGQAVGQTGTGTVPDTTTVPDASKITPPITPKDTRAGHDISLKVEVNAGVPIHVITCDTHPIDLKSPSQDSVVVTLKNQAAIPNKDFVLKYEVAGEQIQSGVITTAPGGAGGFFTLIMQPPKNVSHVKVTPKEMIFVIDTSGSQMGEPLAKSKETMLHCIRNVNPDDTFNMISFSNDVKKLFESPQPFTKETEEKALEYLKECEAGGGTYMLPAMKAALDPPADPNRLRIVVFFTDGFIGNDFEIVDTVQKSAGNARVFSFGIGSSVNRFLVEKMAEEGRGASEVVLLNADSKAIAEKFYNRIRNPLLTDISVDWGGLPISAQEVYPKRIPDLFSAQPLVLKGCYNAPASGEITIHGRYGGQPWSKTIQVELPKNEPDNDSLISVWARAKVDDLMSRDWLAAQTGQGDSNLKEDIINVALQHNLMTQYTSFVAVEKMTVTQGGKPVLVNVPVEMPEGVSYEGILGADVSQRGVVAGAPVVALQSSLGRNVNLAYGGLAKGQATGKPAPTGPATPALSTNSIAVDSLELELAEPEATPEQKRDRLIAAKLDRQLTALAKNYEAYLAASKAGKLEIPKGLVVKGDKVRVMVWLKADGKNKLAELAKIGLSDRAWIIKDKVLMAWLPIAKLNDAAVLEFVSRISAPDYAKSK